MSETRKRGVIGYCLSERKIKRLNWTDFAKVCAESGYELVNIDLNGPLENQGNFSLILHKLADVIALSMQNNEQAFRMVQRLEDYINTHEEVVLIDPLPSVRNLLHRSRSFEGISSSNILDKYGVFVPSFVELTSDDTQDNLTNLRKAGVSFPFICKPSIGDGSGNCHKMALIFGKSGLKDCKRPCVAQSFINHNAVLFKVFIIGKKYHVVKRPSLKNFYKYKDRETIFFNSNEISKSHSSSPLSILDNGETATTVSLESDRIAAIVQAVREAFKMSLLGVDIVIENDTNKYAIVDINSYPGYDGYPNFFEDLLECILETIDCHRAELSNRPQ